MKIATYHKKLGDKVWFFKGNVNDLVVERRIIDCLKQLRKIDKRINWEKREGRLYKYFKTKKLLHLQEMLIGIKCKSRSEIEETLRRIAFCKPTPFYDRVYVTTLFTFYWRETIKTIQQAKQLVNSMNNLYVGGPMASLLHEQIEETTGVKPIFGLLDQPNVLDLDNNLIVDDLPLDYSILEEIEYKYPTRNAYFTFMTKGCTRKCSFCSVPILEPTYKERVPTIEKFKKVNDRFGEQRNLLLMDNNVLASPKFPEIVEEIKAMGFHRGAKYEEPNQFEIAFNNLIDCVNDKAYINKSVWLLHNLYEKRLKGQTKIVFKQILIKYNLTNVEATKKRDIKKAYKEVAPIFEKYRKKVLVDRYVDFNQGIDGHYVNADNMGLLSQLNIRPLRIAFDHIGMKKQYINAVELAAKYDVKSLSNYVLYNFKDGPEDLYERLRINVDLNQRLGLKIFSFPMKFIPVFGEEAKHRKHIGPKWNRKFIRAIQSILNVTKGIVAPGVKFFEAAFGRNIDEYFEILYMPEVFIIYRNKFEEAGLTNKWREVYYGLSEDEREEAQQEIIQNDYNDVSKLSTNPKIIRFLKYYTISEKKLDGIDVEREKLRDKFNKFIREDLFVGLSITDDYNISHKKTKKQEIAVTDYKNT